MINNTPQRRVVILGASNVVRSLRVVVDTACQAWGMPLDILAAIGHGRSYGLTSSVLGRTLPGILECDLWSEWQTRSACPTAALITDIGNDILYGDSPERIANWVQRCLQYVADRSERLIMTELPLVSIAAVPPRRFLILRSLLFPRSRITFDQAMSRAGELNERLLALAQSFGATVVKPSADWYGLDPIHILAQEQRRAWRTILASWETGEMYSPPAAGSKIQLLLARPKYRRVFGITQNREQPCVTWPDGTHVSLY